MFGTVSMQRKAEVLFPDSMVKRGRLQKAAVVQALEIGGAWQKTEECVRAEFIQ
jgi:hypothetical protein